ncbi:hypothetical protein V5O48_006870 [Marasmius crinis-equi]|uniref:Uncharacterized protein n=1 Tax=Marasmius crinis-equi TaxID=585013 RepID=A0ABR3FIQ8_9AGAR
MVYPAYCSSSSSSVHVLEEDYTHYPPYSNSSSSSSSSSSCCPSSSSARRTPYAETSSERRAHLEFLNQEREREIEEELMIEVQEDQAWSRVSSWVQNQVDNSAFLVMAAAKQEQRQRRRRRASGKEPRTASTLRFSHIPSDEDEDESENDLIARPLSGTKCPTSSSYTPGKTPQCPSLPPCSMTSSKRRRRRRFAVASSTSSLDSIPEE